MIYKKKSADFGQTTLCAENIEHAEDKIIELCNSLLKDGVSSLEVASALLFSMHCTISQQDRETAEMHYRILFEQYRNNLRAWPEFF